MDQGRNPAASDEELLRRLGDGEESAWREFYGRYQGRVYRFAYQMTGSRELAEEAVQETFLALMQTASRFDAGRGEAAGYVFGIARHKVCALLGRERSYVGLEEDFDAPSAEDAEEGYAERQTAERVRLAVLTLPAGYREAVVLCDLQQLEYAQAAGVVGCAVGTIRSRLHRGRQLLAEKLASVVERRGCGS
jgi:RNA polymerase sigma-70 factor (ECF subfamily)